MNTKEVRLLHYSKCFYFESWLSFTTSLVNILGCASVVQINPMPEIVLSYFINKVAKRLFVGSLSSYLKLGAKGLKLLTYIAVISYSSV